MILGLVFLLLYSIWFCWYRWGRKVFPLKEDGTPEEQETHEDNLADYLQP